MIRSVRFSYRTRESGNDNVHVHSESGFNPSEGHGVSCERYIPGVRRASGADKTRQTERAATRFAGSRAKKFLSYYKPYRGLLLADLLCAFVISAAALLLPVCTNFITKNLLAKEGAPDALDKIYALGAAMLALVALQALCTLFVDYQGHVMGAKMERDMRRELFEHYQKLSFSFYDRQRTGQLMARITNDLLSLAELYHHGPEDLAIAALELIGVLVILAHIDRTLTLIVICASCP